MISVNAKIHFKSFTHKATMVIPNLTYFIKFKNVVTDCDSGTSTPCSSIGSSGHKGSLRGTKLARRARSFKDDFLEKISQIRTPSSTMTR